MNRTTTLLTATLGLLLGASQLPAATLKANIPFAFDVDGRQMPAGEYQVRVDYGAGPARITIRNAELPKVAAMVAQFTDEPRQSCACLKFYAFSDGRKALSQVGLSGGTPNRQLISGERARIKHEGGAPVIAMIPLIAAE